MRIPAGLAMDFANRNLRVGKILRLNLFVREIDEFKEKRFVVACIEYKPLMLKINSDPRGKIFR